MTDCICGDMPPGGTFQKGEEPPAGCPDHDPEMQLLPRCCICRKRTSDGNISTGDINNPVMKPCCNGCFKDMVCP